MFTNTKNVLIITISCVMFFSPVTNYIYAYSECCNDELADKNSKYQDYLTARNAYNQQLAVVRSLETQRAKLEIDIETEFELAEMYDQKAKDEKHKADQWITGILVTLGVAAADAAVYKTLLVTQGKYVAAKYALSKWGPVAAAALTAAMTVYTAHVIAAYYFEGQAAYHYFKANQLTGDLNNLNAQIRNAKDLLDTKEDLMDAALSAYNDALAVYNACLATL